MVSSVENEVSSASEIDLSQIRQKLTATIDDVAKSCLGYAKAHVVIRSLDSCVDNRPIGIQAIFFLESESRFISKCFVMDLCFILPNKYSELSERLPDTKEKKYEPYFSLLKTIGKQTSQDTTFTSIEGEMYEITGSDFQVSKQAIRNVHNRLLTLDFLY